MGSGVFNEVWPSANTLARNRVPCGTEHLNRKPHPGFEPTGHKCLAPTKFNLRKAKIPIVLLSNYAPYDDAAFRARIKEIKCPETEIEEAQSFEGECFIEDC